MDQIRESLENIAELSEDEIKSLEDAILKEYASVKDQDPSPEVVETLKSLQTAAKAVKEEKTRRVDEAAQLAAEVADAVSSIEELTTKESDGDKSDDDEVADDSMEAVDAEETIAEDEVAVAAEDVAPATEDKEEEEKKKSSVEFSAETPVVEAASELSAEVNTVSEFASEEPAVDETAKDEEKTAEFATEETVVELAVEAAPEEDVTVEDEEKSEEFSAEAPETVVEETENNEVAEEFATKQSESTEEPVTASTIPTPEASDNQIPAESRVKIYAGADLPGITAGAQLPDLAAVSQALLDRKKNMGRTSGGNGEQSLVASIKTSYDSSRELHFNDPDGNRAKINSVVDGQAIVAAGGLSNPVETSYDIYGLGETADRPVRDSLAVFKADRGGIRFMSPPVLADLNDAVSLWTLQDDIDAATEGSTKEKPCLRVSAGVETTVYTDAIPLCLTFGNLGARAYPELVERHTELAMVQHARFAETRLITRIGTLSTSVSAPAQLGAARDILVQVDTAAAGFRSRYRLDPKAPMRAMFPEWFKNALRADLVKQIPGDGQEAALNLAEATINAWFRSRGITVTWFLDGEDGQIFGAQGAGALLQFPANVIWYLFPEGTFLFLDGGDLDLGLVRDSTLNGTNDYKVFLETFEGVAKVGVESLRISSTLKIAGASAGTVQTV